MDGAYFITICTHQKISLFGEVIGAEMHLNACGQIVAEEWRYSAEIRQEIVLDEWVIMPNHMHAIVFICRDDRDVSIAPVVPAVANPGFGSKHKPHGPRPRSLSSLVAGFKAAATKRINMLRQTPGVPIWQDRFYDHIIRDERDLDIHRDYIPNNPGHWTEDRDNWIFLDK